MQVLRTERLLLRPASNHDADFIFGLMNTEGYLTQIGDRGVGSAEDAVSYLQTAPIYRYGPDGLGFNIVEIITSGDRVGICGLVKRDGLADVDLGYAIRDRHSGKGYASEAAAATLRHAHDELRLTRIVAITAVTNEGSRRVLEKIGMRLEEIIRLESQDADTCLYASNAAG